MKASHWSAFHDPDKWPDNPVASPEQAAVMLMEDSYSYEADDCWFELRHNFLRVVVHGFVETDDLLDDGDAFDGYEPGQTYYVSTGETTIVQVQLQYTVVETANCPDSHTTEIGNKLP